MGFWSKVANVATGGLTGMAKPLLKGNVKGALMGAATGGLYAGKNGRGRGGGPSGLGQTLRSARNAPAPMAGAQDYMNTFSPEDQKSIQSSWGGNQNGMNDWFSAAQGAGAVPKPQAAPPPMQPPAAPGGGGVNPAMGMAPGGGAGQWGAEAAVNQGDMGIMRDIQMRRRSAKLGGMLE